MLITIVIATYNSSQYLEQCLQSIITQTYKNIEIIIIDGGSTDNTKDILIKYESYIYYWVSELDKGIYDAWNKALKHATGDWISFIGSDDLYYFDAIENYVNHINNHPHRNTLEFVSSKIDLVTKDLELIETVGQPWNWTDFQKTMLTWHVGTFHARNLFSKYGLFDTSYKTSGDYELLLRPREKLQTSYFDKHTVKMRIGGISSKQLILASQETYRAKIKNKVLCKPKGLLLAYIDILRLKYLRK